MKKSALLLLLVFSVFTTYSQTSQTRDVSSFTEISFRIPGTFYVKQGSPQNVTIEGNQDILDGIETRVSGGQLIIEKDEDMFSSFRKDDKIIVRITVPDIEALRVGGSGNLIGEGTFTTKNLSLAVSGSGSLTVSAKANGNINANVSGSGNLQFTGSCNAVESRVSGSGQAKIDATIAEKGRFDISGAGRIVVSGTAAETEMNISGSGKLLAVDLEVARCNVRISGSGTVEIGVKDYLDANISGSGSVRYKGSPNYVNSHSSGSGRVIKI